MPFVTRVCPDEREIRSIQPTEVECRYLVKEIDDGPANRSDERQFEGKLSQTLQFDEKSARQLWEILGAHSRFR